MSERYGCLDADTVDALRFSREEKATLEALVDAIAVCTEFEFATVNGAAGFMREQRQDELMCSPYSCSRDDDERHDEWRGMHYARHLEVFVSTTPLVRVFETTVANLVEAMWLGGWDNTQEMAEEQGCWWGNDEWIAHVAVGPLIDALEDLADIADRFGLWEPFSDGVIGPVVQAAQGLADVVRFNEPDGPVDANLFSVMGNNINDLLRPSDKVCPTCGTVGGPS